MSEGMLGFDCTHKMTHIRMVIFKLKHFHFFSFFLSNLKNFRFLIDHLPGKKSMNCELRTLRENIDVYQLAAKYLFIKMINLVQSGGPHYLRT